MMPQSNWLTRYPFKVKIPGSNPGGITKSTLIIIIFNIIINYLATKLFKS